MRKKPTFPDRECTMCGKTYTPHSSQQKYCPDCSIIADKERKRKSYKKYHPNAYAPPKPKEFCIVCGKPMECHFDGKPYCNKHWLRMYNNGTINPKPYKTKNRYYIFDNIAVGVTTRGDFYKIDLEDLERCKQHTWIKDPRGYFVSNIGGRVTPIHRFLLNTVGKDKSTDHINGNRSDNRKANLRICSQFQNSKNLKRKKNNTSGYPGIEKVKNGWRATIMFNRKSITIGVYKTFSEALKNRQDAEIKYFGEFAPCLSRKNLLY